MTQATAPDLSVEAKLLGIMLSGVFEQTRADCCEERRVGSELRPSGAYRIDARGVESTLEPRSPSSDRGPTSR